MRTLDQQRQTIDPELSKQDALEHLHKMQENPGQDPEKFKIALGKLCASFYNWGYDDASSSKRKPDDKS